MSFQLIQGNGKTGIKFKKKTAESVTNIKGISDKKTKQKKTVAPQQHIFENIRELKPCYDDRGKYLIYKINQNK